MIYTSRLDDKKIHISSPERDKRYAIMLSGGLDSAVLLYLLYHRGYRDLQIFTIDKADGSTTYATRVVEHFNKKFALKLPKPVTVGDPNAHHSLQSRTALTDIFANYQVDILFNALNKNPPELNELPSAPVRATQAPPKVELPFIDLYKTHIIDLMFDLEQQDLVNITHSCTEQPVGRCNKCWQCGERAWAFQQLDEKDTGTQ